MPSPPLSSHLSTTRIVFGLTVPGLLVIGLFWLALSGRTPGTAALHTVRIEPELGHGWPRTAIAATGTRALIAKPPERIAIANTAALDTALDVVGTERIVAVCEQAFTWSKPARDEHLALRETLRALPNFHELTAESVLQHRPDLVLVSAFNDPGTVASLLDAGTPIVCLPHPTTFAEVYGNIRLFGRAVGAEPAADRLIRDLERRCAAIANSVHDDHRPVALFYSNKGNSGSTFAAGTLAHAALEAAGLRNGTDQLGISGFANLSFEDLALVRPDILIISKPAGEVSAPERQILAATSLGDVVPAVARGQYVELHPSLYSTSGPEIVTVVEILADASAHFASAGSPERDG